MTSLPTPCSLVSYSQGDIFFSFYKRPVPPSSLTPWFSQTTDGAYRLWHTWVCNFFLVSYYFILANLTPSLTQTRYRLTIGSQWVMKCKLYEGTGHDLISGDVLKFFWRDWEEPQNASFCVLTGIQMGHIPNRSIAWVNLPGTSYFLCPSILIMLKASSLSSGSLFEIWY